MCFDKDGTVNKEFNPNGSLLNIAGIGNINRNIFGMMPHLESAADTNLSSEESFYLIVS